MDIKRKAITWLGLALLHCGKPFTEIGNWFWRKHREVLDMNDGS
jgi:hypothetical protein|tara:strand:+ start:477 stop:608 length:132 start_codon:yes stop_codon:yes gene_type:complete